MCIAAIRTKSSIFTRGALQRWRGRATYILCIQWWLHRGDIARVCGLAADSVDGDGLVFVFVVRLYGTWNAFRPINLYIAPMILLAATRFRRIQKRHANMIITIYTMCDHDKIEENWFPSDTDVQLDDDVNERKLHSFGKPNWAFWSFAKIFIIPNARKYISA